MVYSLRTYPSGIMSSGVDISFFAPKRSGYAGTAADISGPSPLGLVQDAIRVIFSDSDNKGAAFEHNGFVYSSGETSALCDNASVRKLNSIAMLKDGWNGGNAPAFTHALINKVRTILGSISEQPDVFPIAGGAIQLEFHNRHGGYLELEISEDEPTVVFQVDKNGAEKEFYLSSETEIILKEISIFYE